MWMEFCENCTLSDIIEQGVTLNEAWRLLRQIVEGLAHIHATGIIHRDLKRTLLNFFSKASVRAYQVIINHDFVIQ